MGVLGIGPIIFDFGPFFDTCAPKGSPRKHQFPLGILRMGPGGPVKSRLLVTKSTKSVRGSAGGASIHQRSDVKKYYKVCKTLGEKH